LGAANGDDGLEQAVKRITRAADFFGIGIAAVSSPGSRPTSRFSTSIESALQNARGCKRFTGGGRRLVMPARGIEYTIVNGDCSTNTEIIPATYQAKS